MKQKIIIFSIPLVLILNSCIIKNKPINTVDFANVKQIKQLEGCYVNISESNSDHNTFLSQILWKEKDIVHENIKIICVKALNSHDLEVIANGNKQVLHKKIFTKDKDFTLESGKITLLNKLGSVTENIAAITHESTVIGIDTEGNGKLTKTGSFIGVAILIPFVGHVSDTYRFSKIK